MISTHMRFALPYFFTIKRHKNTHTCAIYYLSVDFCFMVYIRCFGLTNNPSALTSEKTMKEGKPLANTKERLLSFLPASTQGKRVRSKKKEKL